MFPLDQRPTASAAMCGDLSKASMCFRPVWSHIMRQPYELATICRREYEILTVVPSTVFAYGTTENCNIPRTVPVEVPARQNVKRVGEIRILGPQLIAIDVRQFQSRVKLLPTLTALLRLFDSIGNLTRADHEHRRKLRQRILIPYVRIARSSRTRVLKIAKHKAVMHKRA